MTQTIDKTWDLLRVAVEKEVKKCSELSLDESAYETYKQNFKNLYGFIKKEYMKDKVKNLDRHKVAAIVIASIVQSEAVKYLGEIESGKTFFGQYLIASVVGMNYLQDRLNALLKERKLPKIEGLDFPEALSCDTKYLDIFSRNLYYSHGRAEWGINPLDIAEKLFLLEYRTLEKNGIDPKELKEE